jgi:uncharacterized damage-inducible protein DinB
VIRLPQDLLILRDAVRVMLLRELRALDREIAAYPDDQSLWQTPAGISNSAGTLVLHLAGNLRHFIGAALGESGYIRNREAEFSTKDLSREELQAEVRATITDLERALDGITAAQLEAPYPLIIQDRRVRTADWLVHLSVHLGYHLGQIDYHRRLLTSDPQAADVVSIRELPDLNL